MSAVDSSPWRRYRLRPYQVEAGAGHRRQRLQPPRPDDLRRDGPPGRQERAVGAAGGFPADREHAAAASTPSSARRRSSRRPHQHAPPLVAAERGGPGVDLCAREEGRADPRRPRAPALPLRRAREQRRRPHGAPPAGGGRGPGRRRRQVRQGVPADGGDDRRDDRPLRHGLGRPHPAGADEAGQPGSASAATASAATSSTTGRRSREHNPDLRPLRRGGAAAPGREPSSLSHPVLPAPDERRRSPVQPSAVRPAPGRPRPAEPAAVGRRSTSPASTLRARPWSWAHPSRARRDATVLTIARALASPSTRRSSRSRDSKSSSTTPGSASPTTASTSASSTSCATCGGCAASPSTPPASARPPPAS